MFQSRTLNNTINRLHERALRIVYKDPLLTFQQLLAKDNSHNSIQGLAAEIFKIKKNLSHKFMNSIFPNLRSKNTFNTFNVRTVGTETFRGPKTWALVLEEIKYSNSLPEFR